MKRTIYTPNEIIKYDTYAEIVLYNKECIEIARAQIDLEDVERVSTLKWGLDCGYARNNKNKIRLHRFIMQYNGGKSIDHIDGNKLNNRKSNLRICEHSENLKNIKIPKNNRSGIIGVIWDKEKQQWRVEIKCNGKKIFGGRFNNKEEAIRKRLSLEKELFGEFAPQKHLFEKYL